MAEPELPENNALLRVEISAGNWVSVPSRLPVYIPMVVLAAKNGWSGRLSVSAHNRVPNDTSKSPKNVGDDCSGTDARVITSAILFCTFSRRGACAQGAQRASNSTFLAEPTQRSSVRP